MDKIDAELSTIQIGIVLRQIIGDVIGVDLSGIEDDASLLDCVPSSLELVEGIRRVYDRFGVFVSLRDLLESRATVATVTLYLDQAIKAQKNGGVSGAQESTPDKGCRKIPLAAAQKHVAFLMRYSSGASAAFNEAFAVQLDGTLYIPALQAAVEATGARHEALQSALSLYEDALEVSSSPLELMVSNCDPGELNTRLLEIAGEPFKAGERLFRAELLCLADGSCTLALVGHGLLLDVRALSLLMREISDLYCRLSIQPAPSALKQSIVSGQEEFTGVESAEVAIRHWAEFLSGELPVLALPCDRPRPAVKNYKGARLEVFLDCDLDAQIEEWAAINASTAFDVIYGAFTAMLHRVSGQNEILVGVDSSPDPPREAGRIIRSENMLPARSRYDHTRSFAEHIAEQAEVLSTARKFDQVSLAELIQTLHVARDQSRSPLFTAGIRKVILPSAPAFGSHSGSILVCGAGARYDLELVVMSIQGGGTRFYCDYSTELFDRATVGRWNEGMIEFLRGGIENASKPCGMLPIMSSAERHRILYEWNQTERQLPRDLTTLHLVVEHARTRPQCVAIRGRGEEWTYGQLEARAKQIAGILRTNQVAPGDRIGILLPRSPELVASMLATWMVGAAYVPLDRSFPRKRLGFMLKDAAIKTVITNRQLAKTVEEESDAKPLYLDVPQDKDSALDVLPECDPASVAYVIYTSGSTGEPKGVEIGHRALVNFLLGSRDILSFTARDTLLAITTVTFDISNLELYLPLIAGGVVEIAEDGLAADGFRLAERLEMRKPSFMQATASTWKAVLAAGWGGAEAITILSAGEALSRELGELLLLKARAVWNLYGPTETTVYSAFYEVVSSPGQPMSIGRPYPNTQLYILDEQRQPVAIGVIGELYIGGEGIARGYWQRPELTEARFIPNPFRQGERLYCTGDLSYYLPGGDVVCLGRRDDQLKIHGVRVEPGEIEVALRGVQGVRDAVVTSWTDSRGDAQLVAHVLPTGRDSDPQPSEIRRQLRERLPESLIPPYILLTTGFPLTANGKVHRAALPPPQEFQSAHRKAAETPDTPTERQLAGVWSGLLGVSIDHIGRDDEFMDLGGHSLLMTQLMVEVRKLFSVTFSMRDFFTAGTLRKFAILIDDLRLTRPALEVFHRSLPIRDPKQGRLRMAFLRNEANLPPSIAPVRGLTYQSSGSLESALLTGATGFLGAYILAEVLQTTEAHLYCLLRPKPGVDGRSRIEAQLRHYELWKDDQGWQSAWKERIHVVEGDVILPRLGMSDAAYESLARRIDGIIHSAAHVNFIYPYEALKATNVLGVHEIIRFGFHGRIKPVHYLSTAAVWPMGAEYTFFEQDSLDLGELLNLGYDEAKWVGEQCLLHAADRGLPVARFRPGEVGGDSQTGRCVLSHFVVAGLKGFLQFGALPTIDTELDVTPVDYVAKAIVRIAFHGNPLGRAFHLTNPTRCHIGDAYAFLRSLGYQFEEVPWDRLRSRLISSNEFVHNALFPYQAMLEAVDEKSLQLPNYNCQDALRELEGSGIVCPPVSERLLGTYMDHLQRVGFMPAPVEGALRVGVHAS